MKKKSIYNAPLCEVCRLDGTQRVCQASLNPVVTEPIGEEVPLD